MNPDPDDVTFQFNQIQLTDEDADVSFGFNQANDDGSKSVELTPENDDVANDDEIGSVSQQLTPENDDVEKSPENEDSRQITPENSPEKDDVDNGDNDVTFASSQVRINNSKEMKPEDADVDGEDDDVDDEDDDVTFASSQVRINNSKEMKPEDADVDGEDDDVDDEDDDVTFGFSQANADVEGEEFTFMCINSDNEITELTEKTVFPLFDQSLLYNNNINNEDGKRINVPVNNVFIESPRDSRADTSSSSSSSTTLTAITDSNEMNIKSNSTGFSKLWRFRDNNNINRSNSDGRDAFVFLNNPKTEGGNGKGFLNNAKTEGNGKGKAKEVVKKKVKKANVGSAHEVYLKQKGGGEEEFKRKSYLPYRPGLMGFFTNVNGGLSKNVHPF